MNFKVPKSPETQGKPRGANASEEGRELSDDELADIEGGRELHAYHRYRSESAGSQSKRKPIIIFDAHARVKSI